MAEYTKECACRIKATEIEGVKVYSIIKCPLCKSAPDLYKSHGALLKFVEDFGSHRCLADYPEQCDHCILIKEAKRVNSKADAPHHLHPTPLHEKVAPAARSSCQPATLVLCHPPYHGQEVDLPYKIK